jgi:hypothetical protein
MQNCPLEPFAAGFYAKPQRESSCEQHDVFRIDDARSFHVHSSHVATRPILASKRAWNKNGTSRQAVITKPSRQTAEIRSQNMAGAELSHGLAHARGTGGWAARSEIPAWALTSASG